MEKPTINGNTITIPSSQDFLADVDNFVEGYLEEKGVEKSVIADIAICVTEIVINGIIHGNQSNPDKKVGISVKKENSAIEVIIKDQGGGYNPEDVENPIDEKNLLKEVGRGLFIVKNLMDDVKVVQDTDGTKTTLLKKLS